MISLRWAPFPGADVTAYRVYRSIIGFAATLVDPSVVDGKDLELKIDGGSLQVISFSGTDPVADQINASLDGAKAFVSDDDTQILIRSNTREAPGSVEIFGGTALSDLGLVVKTYTEKSHDELVGEIQALSDPSEVVVFDDPDGVLEDWYAVTTLNSQGQESNKSPYKQATSTTGKVCVLEGLLTDLQGVRIPDAKVEAELVQFPHDTDAPSHISTEPVTTLTREDGRFSLPLLQGALVALKIPAVGYNRNIKVPEKAFEFITDLKVDLDYRYPLGVR